MHGNNRMEAVPFRIERVANSRLQAVDFPTVAFGECFQRPHVRRGVS